METFISILFFHLLISYIFRKNIKHSVLSCGLFAFVSDSPKKFSWDKFNILGIYNTSRGRDACGRVGFGAVEKSDDQTAEYSKYITKFNPSIKGSTVVVGHTRKASIGKKNDLFTQPIVIRAGYDIVDKKLETASKEYKEWIQYIRQEYGQEFPIFALAHNGTIHNYTDLLDQYKLSKTFKYYSIEESSRGRKRKKTIETENLNDSMALTNIIYLYGYEVLSQYIGSAAILCYDMFHRDALFVYHGESPRSSYYVAKEVERPLYYYEVGNNSFYLSSLEDSLLAISDTEKKIHPLPTNQVIKIEGGKMEVVEEIDRSKMYQIEYKVDGSHNKNTYNSSYYWDDIGYNRGTKTKNLGKSLLKYNEAADLNNEPYPSLVFGSNDINYRKGIVSLGFYKGKYWEYHGTDDKLRLANGLYLVNYSGVVAKAWKNEHEKLPTIISKASGYSSNDSLYPLFIYNGILIKSFNHYVIIRDTMEKLRQIKFTKSEKSRVNILKGRFIASASLHPVFVDNDNVFSNLEDVDEMELSKVGRTLLERLSVDVNSYISDLNYQYFSGSFSPLFTNRTYVVSTARLRDIMERELKSPRTVFSHELDRSLSDYLDENRLFPVDTSNIKSAKNLLRAIKTEDCNVPVKPHQLSLPAANMVDRLKKVKYINSVGRNILLSNPIFCERCPLVVSKSNGVDVCSSCYIGQYYDELGESIETVEEAEKFVRNMLEREVKIPDRYANLVFSVETINSFKNVNSFALGKLFGNNSEKEFVYSELLDPDDPMGVNIEYEGEEEFEISKDSKSKIKKELSSLLKVVDDTKTTIEKIEEEEEMSDKLSDIITVFEVFKEEIIDFSLNNLYDKKSK